MIAGSQRAGGQPAPSPGIDTARVRLSIVIVSWNGWRDLERCLQSIECAKLPSFEVLVIDNASSDGSAENLRRYFPNVRVHENSRNVGHTRGVNQGLQLVSGDFVLLLDADTELSEEAVDRMLGFLVDNPSVALVAPRTFGRDGQVHETARNLPTAMNGLLGRQSILIRWFPRSRTVTQYLRRDALAAREPFRIEFVSAACMLFRREMVERLGPWDEGFPGYWADADWCARLKAIGGEVFCVPEARIVHHEQNRRGAKKSPRRIWMFHQGAFRLYRKHYTRGSLDPRLWLAAMALASRAVLLIGVNALRSGDRG
jgi:hypothetical protein